MQQAGRSPAASKAVESPLAGKGEHQRGVDGFRKGLLASCQLQQQGCGRAAEGSSESGTGTG